jgi:hypothetical protein
MTHKGKLHKRTIKKQKIGKRVRFSKTKRGGCGCGGVKPAYGGSRRKLRKMKGGFAFSNAFSSLTDSSTSMNVVGSGQQTSLNTNIFAGNSTEQPVSHPYGGDSNPPIV